MFKNKTVEIKHYDFAGIVETKHYSYSIPDGFFICYGYGSRRSEQWPDESFQPLYSFFREIERKLSSAETLYEKVIRIMERII